MTKKLSIDKIKKIDPKLLLALINKAKRYLKKDKVMQDAFKEHNVDIEVLDYIPIYFKDLDVSAKTDRGIIYLNYKLLEDGLSMKDSSYILHEATHFFQQCFGDKPTQSSDDGDYLSNPYEEEAFSNQIDFISDHYGDQEADNYVEHLLDHHDIESKTEREDKKEVLLSKV